MVLDILVAINNFIWNKLIIWLLLGSGLFFTIYFRFIQVGMAVPAIKAFINSRQKNKQQISSFQAFCTSLAQRVGTGNLAGVATAISSGGEGAIFWMWVTAFLGASTSFVESTLAQVFKIKSPQGTYYGGPAYYIHAGLKSKKFASLFSISLILALGFVLNGVQSNTIAQGLKNSFVIDPLYSGLALAAMSSVVIFGGVKRIAQVAEVLVPLMALLYLSLTAYVMLVHVNELADIISRIINAAFATKKAAVGGVLGYSMQQAFRYGVARGLFSNEAGWGTAPNAAATADVSHPVQQGLIQMIAVYVDTLLICSATAFLILLSGQDFSGLNGIGITQNAAVAHFGPFGHGFIAITLILFGFTTILGNALYGEANVQFITDKRSAVFVYRLIVLLTVVLGAISEVPLVWELADLMSAIMLLINLCSIILLVKIAKKTLNHFDKEFIKDPAKTFSFTAIGLSSNAHYNFAFKEQKNPKRTSLTAI